jgi:hypothetical protein
MSHRCPVRPHYLAALIGLSAPAVHAQPAPPPLARSFAPLAELIGDVEGGFSNASRLKREIEATEKKLKKDRKTYMSDGDRVARLRDDAETAKQQVTGANRKWLCNRYGSYHDKPSECSDPKSGGVWVVVGADGKARRWTEPTKAQIDVAARAALDLEIAVAKLIQDKERISAAEKTLRADLEKYNRLIDDVTAKSAKLADPKKVLGDVARSAGDETTVRKINELDKMLGKAIGEGKLKGQCAVLVQEYAKVGTVDTWKPGDPVGRATPVAPFAPIATFVDGTYPNKPKGNHAAIVLDRTRDGLLVFDQYSGKSAGMREIRFKGGTAAKANQESIQRGETEATAKGLTEADGIDYYTLKYKYYSPSNDADNYSYVK